MTLLPTGWIKMPGDNDETKRFAWSHVKSIFYNKAANVLLKDKLDEMDKIIDEKIAKALMSNVQVNDQSKIPTSALAYAMQQSITKNGQDIAKLNNNLFSNVARVTDVHSIGKSCLFRAEHGSANTPTSDLGYIGISVYVSSNWQFVICSPYAGGKLFFDSVNTTGSWIGWKEIAFK